jgi:hypothetical protein
MIHAECDYSLDDFASYERAILRLNDRVVDVLHGILLGYNVSDVYISSHFAANRRHHYTINDGLVNYSLHLNTGLKLHTSKYNFHCEFPKEYLYLTRSEVRDLVKKLVASDLMREFEFARATEMKLVKKQALIDDIKKKLTCQELKALGIGT